MKIATLTFHGAHNYGSMLQAYALQTFVRKIIAETGRSCEYKILNYRSDIQKQLYSPVPGTGSVAAIKGFLYSFYKNQLDAQRQKFEDFMVYQLNTTEEFSNSAELPHITRDYDCLLSGSDQVWNIRAQDFDFSYLFEGCNQRKMSYAASLGPLQIDWSKYDKTRFLEAIRGFDCISVREEKSKKMLAEVYPGVDAQVHVDPTLLLDRQEWRQIQSDMNYRDGEYILFYCLEPDRRHIRIAQMLSKKSGLPVVATRYRNKYDYFNPFVKLYDAGPLDFLSLVDHASIVLTSSFHGTAFSLIYGKPFIAIDGMKDGRISNILRLANAKCNAISLDASRIDSMPLPMDVDMWISEEREKSKQYLLKSLIG